MQRTPPSPLERLLACYQQALGHDLPNRLVALQGLARLLAEELTGPLSEDARACLERLVVLPRQMHEQVSALADLGRSVRQPGPVTALRLDELLAEVAREVSFQLKREVVVSCPTPCLLRLPGRGAHRAFAEILRFLVGRTSADRPARVAVSAREGAAVVAVSLAGDGEPLSSAELDSACEPRTDDPRGPSLGMFLARLLVESAGGALRASAGALIVELPSAGSAGA